MVLATGVGSNALGSPIKALGFLIEVLESQSWADPLQAGEIITTGTLTSLPYISSGETWTVNVSGIDLPSLSIVLG